MSGKIDHLHNPSIVGGLGSRESANFLHHWLQDSFRIQTLVLAIFFRNHFADPFPGLVRIRRRVGSGVGGHGPDHSRVVVLFCQFQQTNFRAIVPESYNVVLMQSNLVIPNISGLAKSVRYKGVKLVK